MLEWYPLKFLTDLTYRIHVSSYMVLKDASGGWYDNKGNAVTWNTGLYAHYSFNHYFGFNVHVYGLELKFYEVYRSLYTHHRLCGQRRRKGWCSDVAPWPLEVRSRRAMVESPWGCEGSGQNSCWEAVREAVRKAVRKAVRDRDGYVSSRRYQTTKCRVSKPVATWRHKWYHVIYPLHCDVTIVPQTRLFHHLRRD